MAVDPDLERARDIFLGNLHSSEIVMATHDRVAAYWREVQVEAMECEEVGKLDRWVRDLARDREKVEALRAQKERAQQDPEQQALVMMIIRLLMVLDEIHTVLKKKLFQLRGMLLSWVVLAGPGAKSKPNPNLQDTDQQKDEKQAKEAALAKKREKAKPTKTKAG